MRADLGPLPGPDSMPGAGPSRVHAVVLAGGTGTRLGRADKPGLLVGGRTLLDHVLETLAELTGAVMLVGPPRPGLPERVSAWGAPWATRLLHTREDPPLGGPLAAVGAGTSALLLHGASSADHVLLLAADLVDPAPELAALLSTIWPQPTQPTPLPRVLLDSSGRVQPLQTQPQPTQLPRVLLDSSGRAQPLLSVWELGELAARLAALEPLPGRSLNQLLSLGFEPVPPPRLESGADVDDRDDLARARRSAVWRSPPGVAGRSARQGADQGAHGAGWALMEEWVGALAAHLGLRRDQVDITAVLDLARDAATSVQRPAAPITTYLAGLAAGLAGGSPEAGEQAIFRAAELAKSWSPSTSHNLPINDSQKEQG